MSAAVKSDATRDETLTLGARRYQRVDTLSKGPRADLSVCVPEGARSLDELVVLKSFHAAAAVASWTPLAAELELARTLCCDQVLRPLAVGLEPGRCFLVHEYLEGATLRACLDWTAARRARWPQAAVGRVLCALQAAVLHAHELAPSAAARDLAAGPIAAEDVFLSQDGQVKLLGFKSVFRPPLAARPAAVDALLEQQLTPELQAALRRLPAPAGSAATDSFPEALRSWSEDELGGDGRAELSRLLQDVEAPSRARQALRLVAAFAQQRGRTLKFRHAADLDDAPAQSGYRRIGATDPATRSEPPGLAPAEVDLADLARGAGRPSE